MSNRYETNYWKKEDWEAHNRLMDAAIQRQRAEFLTDLKKIPPILFSNIVVKLRKKWEGKL